MWNHADSADMDSSFKSPHLKFMNVGVFDLKNNTMFRSDNPECFMSMSTKYNSNANFFSYDV